MIASSFVFCIRGKCCRRKPRKNDSREIFLKVNDILSTNKHGYSCYEENEIIPLKGFLKCGHCGEPMRGYIVKAKDIPYYKCNMEGCCNNKSARELHSIFESGLEYKSVRNI